MNFDDSPEEHAFRLKVRAFLDEHATLRTGTEADWWSGPTDESDESDLAFLRRCQDWARTVYDHGWAGIAWPTAFGGRGESVAQMIVWADEVSRYDVTIGFVGIGHGLVGPPLMRHATPEQQQRYLAPLLRGDEIWCQLFSEPGAGSDLAALSTRAELDGDDVVVSGQKVWTSEAHHADFGILLVRTDPTAPKHHGITFLIVDMRSPGIEVRPLRQASGQAHFNEVFLDEVRIPVANVVGEIDGGWKVARTVMASEAGMIGTGGNDPANYDSMLRLARSLGRTADPLVRQGLADLHAREQMIRFMGMRFQTFLTTGRGTPPDPSVLKNFHTRKNARKADLGLAIQGAPGLLDGADAWEHGLWQRSIVMQFASRIGGGTDEVHRNMIAERALGLPRDPR